MSAAASLRIQKKKKGGALAVAGLAVLAFAPFLLLLVPGVQQVIVGSVDVFADPLDASYDAARPLNAYTGESVFYQALMMLFVLVVFALPAMLLVAAAARRVPSKMRDDITLLSGLLGVGAGFILLITIMNVSVMPLTESSRAKEETPQRTAQWVEERYDITLDTNTAEDLLKETDPVLIDGRLLTLTRVAQGGYVLTEDGSATELPTTDTTGETR